MTKDTIENILPVKCDVDNKLLLDSVYVTKTITVRRLEIDTCIICEII